MKKHIQYFPFADLLPQSGEALLSDPEQKTQILHLLKQYNMVLTEAINAFFLQHNIHAFDPHVGETCCQIRAYHLIKIFHQKDSVFANRQACQAYLTQLEAERLWLHKQFLVERDKQKSQRDKMTLSDFLDSTECNFVMPHEDIKYLCCAFLLTQYCYFNEVGITAMNYKKMMQRWNISKRMAHNLIRCCQRYLASRSCHFLLDLCQEAPSLAKMGKVLAELKQEDDDNRDVMPYYFGFKVLLEHMKFSGQPIVLQAERRNHKHMETVCLLFEYSQALGEYELKPVSGRDPNQTCFVVHGLTLYQDRKPKESRSAYISRLTAFGLEKLLLASMASHVQFVGKKLHMYRQMPMSQEQLEKIDFSQPYEEYIAMRGFANEVGCSLSDASLLVVRHIYCDTLKNQSEMAEFVYDVIKPKKQVEAYS